MEYAEQYFSNDIIAGLFVVVLVCLMLPVFYLIFFTVKKKIDLLTMVFGVLGYLLFGYLIGGFVLGTMAPASAGAEAPMRYALVRSLCLAVVEGGGAFAALFLLRRRADELSTPISYPLGYTLIDVLLVRGILSGTGNLGMAYTVNSVGLEEFMKTVAPENAETMLVELQRLQALEPYKNYFSAADCACTFLLFTAMCRILWYAVKGEGRQRVLFTALALVFRFAAELPTAFFQAGGTENYIVCEVLRYVFTALCVGTAVLLHFRYDEKQRVRDDPVNRRFLRR